MNIEQWIINQVKTHIHSIERIQKLIAAEKVSRFDIDQVVETECRRLHGIAWFCDFHMAKKMSIILESVESTVRQKYKGFKSS